MKNLLTVALICALTMISSGGASAAAPAKDKGETIPVLVGNVKSTEGQPLSASVAVKKTKKKVMTDERGNFILMDVPANGTLVVTYNKVKTEIAVDGRSKVRLTLVDPLSKMKGTSSGGNIETNLGSISKDDYAGSLSELTAEDIERNGYTNLVDAMRGKMGGVLITDEGYVTMRGINTFNGSIYALILLDGTEVESVLDVEAKDVEKVSILKEGDMYGQKGANGVVIINTKH